MFIELARIVHELVLHGAKPAKAIAKEVGKPYSTLLREVNPYDPGAKLGVETFLEIMKQTGSVEPLRFLAESFGYTLVPNDDKAQQNTAGAVQERPEASEELSEQSEVVTERVV